MKKTAALLVICLSIFMLAGCGSSDGSGSGTAPDAGDEKGDAYRVITVDESGSPVEGAMLQFCSDQMCVMGETGADGIAVFEQEEAAGYTVKVFSVPEGFAEDNTEYPVPETYGEMSIILKAAE